MLLIPAAVRKILEQGREEGREEIRRQRREEGREAGYAEGRMEERAKWEAWLKRLEDAEANQVPFSEPPPSQCD